MSSEEVPSGWPDDPTVVQVIEPKNDAVTQIRSSMFPDSMEEEISKPKANTLPFNPERVLVDCPKLEGMLKKFYTYRVSISNDQAEASEVYPGLDAHKAESEAKIHQHSPVYHRYSGFEMLRNHLVAVFPGIFIPPLPPKQLFGSTEADFVKIRMSGLERFLNRLVAIPVIRDSNSLQSFFNTDFNGYEALKKSFQEGSNQLDIAEIYQRRFGDVIFEYQSNSVDESNFMKMKSYLDLQKSNLSKMLKDAESFYSSNKAFFSSFKKIQETVAEISESEELLISTGIIKKHSFARAEIRPAASDLFDVGEGSSSSIATNLVDYLRYNLDDVDAFIQTFDSRLNVYKKYQGFLKNSEKWATKTVTDKNESDKKKAEIDEVQWRNIQQSVSAVLLLQEFPFFIHSHVNSFNESLKTLADSLSTSSTSVRTKYISYQINDNDANVFIL